MLSTGATNRVIAERLFISEKTVSVHVTNILSQARECPTGAPQLPSHVRWQRRSEVPEGLDLGVRPMWPGGP